MQDEPPTEEQLLRANFRRDLAESYKFAAEMRKLTTEGYKLDCEQSLAPVVAVGVLAGVVSGLIATLLTLAVRLH